MEDQTKTSTEPVVNTATCKKCGATGLKITQGKYNFKNAKYVDSEGKAWNGRVCPKCHRENMRERMKGKRRHEPKKD